ncbi:MAG: hypothetical protein SGJ27_22505 [Candidatus Melainabacteria bacterium]|nr:hypothetical protein [Candidatus Melainabacteria bacterium]
MKTIHWLRIVGLGLVTALVIYCGLRLLAFGAPAAGLVSLVIGVGVSVAVLWGLVSHIFSRK